MNGSNLQRHGQRQIRLCPCRGPFGLKSSEVGPGGGDLDLLPRPRGLLDDGSETALGTGGGGGDLDLLLRPARGVLECSDVGGGDDLDLLAAGDRLGISFLLRGRPGRGTSLALVLFIRSGDRFSHSCN